VGNGRDQIQQIYRSRFANLYQIWNKEWLILDTGFIDKQDRNVIAYRINPVTGAAFQRVFVFVISQRSLTEWTCKDFQQIAANHGTESLLFFSETVMPSEWITGLIPVCADNPRMRH
jgi:hypothetical protein